MTREFIHIRQANRTDVPVIVQMLADDFLGATRERIEAPLPKSYMAAFEAISDDPNNELIVACKGSEDAYSSGRFSVPESVRVISCN